MLLGEIPQHSRRLWAGCPAEVLSFKNRPEDRDLSAVSEISTYLVCKALCHLTLCTLQTRELRSPPSHRPQYLAWHQQKPKKWEITSVL